MIYILCAVIFVAAVFWLGVMVGGRRGPEKTSAPTGEAEVSPREEREAFAILMGYNADVAYGVKSLKEE